MSQNEVVGKLLALINSQKRHNASTITLKDGGTIVGIPHGFHMFNNYCSMDVYDPKTEVSRSISDVKNDKHALLVEHSSNNV
jgi:hypothetical protein